MEKNIFTFFLILCISLNIVTCEPKSIIMGTQDEKFNVEKDCDQFQILTNYKHISINIKEIKNVDRVLITDKLFDSCDVKNCPLNSNICQGK
jgi:hypothetical protein